MNYDNNGFDTEEIETLPKRKRKSENDTAKTVQHDKKKKTATREAEIAHSATHSKRAHSNAHKNEKAISDPDSILNIALSYIITFFAIFMIFCTFTESGAIFGRLVRFFNFGLFSYVAYALPFVLAFQGVTWRNNIRRKSGLRRGLATFFAFIFSSALVYTFDPVFDTFKPQHLGEVFAYFFSWADPIGAIHGGGLLGSALGWLLTTIFGAVGTWLIVLLAILLYFVIYFNFSPAAFAKAMSEKTKLKYHENRGKHEARVQSRQEDAEVRRLRANVIKQNEKEKAIAEKRNKQSTYSLSDADDEIGRAHV